MARAAHVSEGLYDCNNVLPRVVPMGWDGSGASHLDNSTDGTASSLEDVLQALAADSRLLGNGALDEVALSISGDLTRDEDVRPSLNGLRLKCNQSVIKHHCYHMGG